MIQQKQALREQMRERIGSLGEGARREASVVVARRLREHPLFREARVVYGFAPRGDEVDWIGGGLESEKIWGFPWVENGVMRFAKVSSLEDFDVRAFGIREPRSREMAPAADLVLVPGVAFTKTGLRLGRGKGYYDRFLSGLHASTLGVAFACQVVEELPVEGHDVRVDGVVSG